MVDGYPSTWRTQAHEPEQVHLQWCKSSYSASISGECVEWAVDEETVRVRDSKRRQGPGLTVGRMAWGAFLERLMSQGRDDL